MENVSIEFWYWWVFGLILLGIELIVPGFFFLWISIAGFLTGCLAWLVPSLSFTVQLLIFSIVSVAAISFWKVYVKHYPLQTDQPLLNKRGAQYIGRVYSLIEPIQNGQGKIKVDDSLWKVYGEDSPVNTRVKVTAIRGTVFDVERVE